MKKEMRKSSNSDSDGGNSNGNSKAVMKYTTDLKRAVDFLTTEITICAHKHARIFKTERSLSSCELSHTTIVHIHSNGKYRKRDFQFEHKN